MLSLSLVCSLRVPYNDLIHRTATSPQPTLLPPLQGSDENPFYFHYMRKLYPINRFFGYSTMDFGTDSDVAQPSGRIPALRSTPRAVLYSNCAAKTRNQQSNRRRERKRRTPETRCTRHTAQSVPWDNGPRISYAGIPIGHRAEPDVRDRKRGVGEGSNPLQVRVGA